MTTWLISADPNIYDHSAAFAKWKYVDWIQYANYEIGDIIYIYASKQEGMIKYRTEVIQIDMDFSEIEDDSEFWKEANSLVRKTSKYVRLKLLGEFNDETLNLAHLREHGLSNPPQKAKRLDGDLLEYIDSQAKSISNYGNANNNTGLIDPSIIERLAHKFVSFVHAMDNNDLPLNFVDGSGFLVKEEGYKNQIPEKARAILNIEEWDESWIGSGKIQDRIYKVMDLAGNLINFNARINFRKHFESDKKEYDPESERVIYEIYRENDDKAAFEHAVEVFGARYAILAYLFFVKDETKYLPASPENFDKSFNELKIDFVMAHKCSWDNYCQFNNIVREICDLLPKYLDTVHDLRLLDAHSFVWFIREDKFVEWRSDINTPMRIINLFTDNDGTTKFQCPNCGVVFKQARRCPECGQLVKAT